MIRYALGAGSWCLPSLHSQHSVDSRDILQGDGSECAVLVGPIGHPGIVLWGHWGAGSSEMSNVN